MITKTVLYSFDGLQRATREEVIEYVNQIMKELEQPIQPPEKIQIGFTIPHTDYIPQLPRAQKPKISSITTPTQAYNFAKRTGVRYPEAEQLIMTDPHTAYLYARDVIKGRWLEAEPFIEKNEYVWGLYANTFSVRYINVGVK